MTYYLLGVMTVLAIRPPNWATVLDRLKGEGLPIEADRHLRAAALRDSWGQHTTEFHKLIGATWAPSTDDSWSAT